MTSYLNKTRIYVSKIVIRIISYCQITAGAKNIDCPDVAFGRHSYGIQNIYLAKSLNQPSISIGHFCSFAPGVTILANADHRTDFPSTYPFRTLLFSVNNGAGKEAAFNYDVVSRGAVEIGNDVWIGLNAIILSGVTIGTGAVIGAGSVVTRDIPPYAIAAGNPAKVVRFRFSPDLIEKLLESNWWMLSDEQIHELEPHLYSNDINRFLDMVHDKKLQTHKE